MERRLDIERWKRREHFEFFRRFEKPFWNVTAELDVTALTESTRGVPSGFFLGCLYCSLRAANAVEPFRYRVRGDQVAVHDVVHAGSTVMRDDETFGFGYFDLEESFEAFATAGRAEIERVRSTRALEDQDDRDDLLHYSVLPWIRFTGFSHARRVPPQESVPRIVFGKRTSASARQTMPISIETHHALVDGLDVGRFLDALQSLLDDPPE